MKSRNKYWLIMIIAGVGLGSSATAYTQFVDEPKTLTQNEIAAAPQPPEGDEGDSDDSDEGDDDEMTVGDDEGDDEGDNANEGDDAQNGEEGEQEEGEQAESGMSDDSESSSDEHAEQEQQQDNPEETFEERTHSIVVEINQAKENKDLERVAELKQQLTEVVNEHFQWLETKRQAQVEALELRLEKLKKLLKVRSNNSDKIIDRRVRSLLNEPDALDWKIK